MTLSRLFELPFVRFALLSAISYVLNLALTCLFHEVIGLAEVWAYLPTIAILIIFNFFTVRTFVYEKQTGSMLKQFSAFVGAVAGFRLLEFATYSAVVCVLLIDYRIAIGVLNPLFAVAKYLWLRTAVFESNKV